MNTEELKPHLQELLKFIGKNEYFVDEDGTVWKHAFLSGYQINVVEEYLQSLSLNHLQKKKLLKRARL